MARGLRTAMLGCIAAALVGCGGGDSPETTTSEGLRYPVGVRPLGASAYLCGTPGPSTLQVMSDLNDFWQSSVSACSCQFDAAPFCTGGAFVGVDPGWIYYDAAAMNRLDVITGSRVPADMVMAHEFGHSVQGWLGLPALGKQKELQADCLAGFYLGSRVRRGLATTADLSAAFFTACSYGDPYLAPWFDLSAHGTCTERVAAVDQGINGNLAGLVPGQACP